MVIRTERGERRFHPAAFWGGVGIMFLSVALLNASQYLYVESAAGGVDWNLVISIMGVGGIAGIIFGGVAIVASSLFPGVRKQRQRRHP